MAKQIRLIGSGRTMTVTDTSAHKLVYSGVAIFDEPITSRDELERRLGHELRPVSMSAERLHAEGI